MPRAQKNKSKAAKKKAEKNSESSRLSREDWINAASAAMEEGGVNEVRVEVLAKRLNVTKGSFYWHFKDREALLKDLLRVWLIERTREVAQLVESSTRDPHERLRLLLELSTESGKPTDSDTPAGRFEQAVRVWAMTSDLAADALREVDNSRIKIMTKLYQACGLKRREASAYAFLFYSYTIGSNTIKSELGLAPTKALHEVCANILTNPPINGEGKLRSS